MAYVPTSIVKAFWLLHIYLFLKYTIKICAFDCRKLTTLWVARLNYGTELKVTDPKEQQRDVEEDEAEGKERQDGVDC